MNFTTGAWIGIGVGLALAVFYYSFALYAVRRGQQKGDAKLDDSKMRILKVTFALGFVIFPLAGYVLGNMLVDQGLLPR
jgi:hypothetical protein